MDVPEAGSVSVAGATLKLAARPKLTLTGSGAWLVRVSGSSARSYCAHSPKPKAERDGETRGANASPFSPRVTFWPVSRTSIAYCAACASRPKFSSASASLAVATYPLAVRGALGGAKTALISMPSPAPRAPISGVTKMGPAASSPSTGAASALTTLLMLKLTGVGPEFSTCTLTALRSPQYTEPSSSALSGAPG